MQLLPFDESGYYQKRFEMEQQWRTKQLELNQERHALGRWALLLIVLITILSGGIAGSVYLHGYWGWLIGLSIVGLVIYIFCFGFFGAEMLTSSWKHRGEIAELKSKQQLLQELWIQGLSIQQYASYYQKILVPQIIEDFQRESGVNRVTHLITQMTIIIASLLVTGLTSGLDTKLGWHILWLAPVLSFIVSLFTSITAFFKFRERSFHMQQTADSIEQEKTALELGIGRYKHMINRPDEAFAEFAERIEYLREEQRKRQQQLEQSSDGKEVAAA